MPDCEAPPSHSAVERAAEVASLGLRERLPRGATRTLEMALSDPDPRVRSVAMSALVRAGSRQAGRRAWRRTLSDPAAAVRRRAAELTPQITGAPLSALLPLLLDRDVTVVEAVAWALGELGPSAAGAGATKQLSTVAVDHADPLAREAAVAALGALADPAGLPAILAACRDKAPVRRRAVLALASFDDPEADAALRAALDDRDWQTRQAAEDLLAE